MSEDRSEAPGRSVRERADKLLGRLAWGVMGIPSMALTGFARLLAYGREGAADVWAEAQSIRRRNLNSEPHASARTGEYVGARVPERDVEPGGEEASAIQTDATRHPLRSWMQASGRTKTTFGSSRTPEYAASSRRT
jgi:hypothetical protein